MNIWATLKRILLEHFTYHMVLPLLVGVLAELLRLMHAAGTLRFPTDTSQFVALVRAAGPAALSLLTPEHAVPLIAVLVAYLVVMFFIITHEADIPFETANYFRVEEALRDATSYSALCDIPMREWFEPGAFKYFALLQGTKIARRDRFHYERIIVFTTHAQKRDAEINTLDRYHAEAFATAHKLFKIPMGWLAPTELRDVVRRMDDLTARERRLFQRVPRLVAWLPDALVCRLPWPVQLDFAVIERPAGKAVIVVPFKKADTVVLEGEIARPYERLAAAIRARVYETDGVTLKLDHDFPRFLGVPDLPDTTRENCEQAAH